MALRHYEFKWVPVGNWKNFRAVNGSKSGSLVSRLGKWRKGSWFWVLPSLAIAGSCLLLFCGQTWAWYTISIESASQELAGANFSLTARVTSGDSNGIGADDYVGSGTPLIFNAKTVYKIEVAAQGTSVQGGYLRLIREGEAPLKFFSSIIKPEETMTFYFCPASDQAGQYRLESVWGYLPADLLEDQKLAANPPVLEETETKKAEGVEESAQRPSEESDLILAEESKGTASKKEDQTSADLGKLENSGSLMDEHREQPIESEPGKADSESSLSEMTGPNSETSIPADQKKDEPQEKSFSESSGSSPVSPGMESLE